MSDPADIQEELQRLRDLIADLTARVYRLERAAGVEPTREHQVRAPEARAFTKPLPTSPAQAEGPAFTIKPRAQEEDLESRIGSHWLNRIGIAAVLIGVSYFLKYAFENNWIGPAGRVTIGLVAGIAIVIWSERFRTRGYPIFSYSLKAVGVGVLYLSLWAAFQVYRLVPGGVAFFGMVAITASTAALAIVEDAQVLAAIALIGGFATPLLLSTGQNRELELFSYVAILDFAALVLVVVKPWRRLLVLTFAGTLILYSGWYSAYYDRSELRLTLAFATLFFAIFAVDPLVAYSERETGPISGKVPYAIVILNAGVYFAQVYSMLEQVDKASSAWAAFGLAGVYIYLSRQLKRRPGGRAMELLHLALALGFITVAVPIRFDAHWITIGWLVEAAALLWVGNRIHSDFLNFFALTALVLAVIRLLVVDNFYPERLLFNQRMLVHAVAITVLGLVAWFGSRRQDEPGLVVAGWSVVALNVLALVALSREVADYYARQAAGFQMLAATRNAADWAHLRKLRIARDFTFSALWMAYGAMLMVVGFWRRSAFVRWQALVLIAVTIVKVFIYDVSQLDVGYRILSFVVLGTLLLTISFAYQRDWLKLSGSESRMQGAE